VALRIGIDIDGVLADFRTAFHATAVRCLRHEVDDQQDLESLTPLSAADVRRVWDYIATAPNWWMDVPAYEPDQIARLYSLMRAGTWEVVFMTKRPPSAGDSVQFQTQWWIERFGFYLPAVVTVPGSRGDIANGLRLDIVLDDQLINCVEVVSTAPTKAVLVHRTQDATVAQQATNRGIGVVTTLQEALTVIERLHDVLPQKRGRLMRLADWFSKPDDTQTLPSNPRAVRPVPPFDPRR
jgi:hypothetical protein